MSITPGPEPKRPKPPRRGRGQGAKQARGADGPPRQTDGGLVGDFIESFLRITKGENAGDHIRLRPWQRHILNDLFALRPDGRRQYRRGLLGLPRKNGKSAIGSGIALYGLFDEPGAEVYSCAGDKDQARIVFAEVRRAVEAEPELAGILKLYRDAIEYPATQSVYRVLSAEAYTKHGLNPSLVLFDEVHVQPDEDLWSVMTSGSGTRRNPLVIGITTAGVMTDSRGQDSLCYRLYRHGIDIERGHVDDSTFYFRWFGAPQEADWRDPATWTLANPALGDYLDREDMDVAARSDPENVFRTLRLNQWVSSVTAWLPFGAWDGLAAPRTVADDERIVLGFDGSWANDSTALVGSTVSDEPYTFVVDAWEVTADNPRIDTDEVAEAIRKAAKRYKVVEIACDPYRWQDVLNRLTSEGLPIVEFPTNSLVRMVPACQEFYTSVIEGSLHHDGDPRLSRHIDNAVVKTDRHGPRIVKESKSSQRKIDLAVAAVVAHNRALFHATQVPEPAARFIPFD